MKAQVSPRIDLNKCISIIIYLVKSKRFHNDFFDFKNLKK